MRQSDGSEWSVRLGAGAERTFRACSDANAAVRLAKARARRGNPCLIYMKTGIIAPEPAARVAYDELERRFHVDVLSFEAALFI